MARWPGPRRCAETWPHRDPAAIHVTQGIGNALEAAHARGIIHRDLKPDNIMLIERSGDVDFVKVLDFGVAKLLEDVPAPGSNPKTRTNALLGTPSYMAPEQCKVARNVDARSDIYSLGVMMYQMTTGRLPFIADGLGEMLLLQMTAEPPRPRSVNAAIPEGLEAAILQALAKAPEDRFQTVSALTAVLGEISRTANFALRNSLPEISPVAEPGDVAPPTDSFALGALNPSATASGQAHPLSVLTGGGGGWQVFAFAAITMALVAIGLSFAVSHRASPGMTATGSGTVLADAGPATGTTAAPRPVIQTAKPAPAPEIHLTVRTTPRNAEVLVDDKPLANPFDGKLARDDRRHRIVVNSHCAVPVGKAPPAGIALTGTRSPRPAGNLAEHVVNKFGRFAGDDSDNVEAG